MANKKARPGLPAWMTRPVAPDDAPSPLRDGCPCDACARLRAALTSPAGVLDTGLVALDGKKLLIRYWAGQVTEAEKRYQQAHAGWAQAAARAGAAAQARLRGGVKTPGPACPEETTPSAAGTPSPTWGSTQAGAAVEAGA